MQSIVDQGRDQSTINTRGGINNRKGGGAESIFEFRKGGGLGAPLARGRRHSERVGQGSEQRDVVTRLSMTIRLNVMTRGSSIFCAH